MFIMFKFLCDGQGTVRQAVLYLSMSCSSLAGIFSTVLPTVYLSVGYKLCVNETLNLQMQI